MSIDNPSEHLYKKVKYVGNDFPNCKEHIYLIIKDHVVENLFDLKIENENLVDYSSDPYFYKYLLGVSYQDVIMVP